MIKIFNIDMAEHFLRNNDTRKLYKCGLYDNHTLAEVDLNTLSQLRKNSKEDLYIHRFFTEDLSGHKWLKYAELDIFDINPNKQYESIDDVREFLVCGYNKIIKINRDICDSQMDIIKKHEIELNHINEIQIQIVNDIKNTIKKHIISESLIKKYYDMYSDVISTNCYVSQTYYLVDENIFIIPRDMEELGKYIYNSMSDPFSSEIEEGYYCIFECDRKEQYDN